MPTESLELMPLPPSRKDFLPPILDDQSSCGKPFRGKGLYLCLLEYERCRANMLKVISSCSSSSTRGPEEALSTRRKCLEEIGLSIRLMYEGCPPHILKSEGDARDIIERTRDTFAEKIKFSFHSNLRGHEFLLQFEAARDSYRTMRYFWNPIGKQQWYRVWKDNYDTLLEEYDKHPELHVHVSSRPPTLILYAGDSDPGVPSSLSPANTEDAVLQQRCENHKKICRIRKRLSEITESIELKESLKIILEDYEIIKRSDVPPAR